MEPLRLNQTTAAEAEISSLMLRQVLGSYELRFNLSVRVLSGEQHALWFAFSGAQVVVEANNLKGMLGVCRSDYVFREVQSNGATKSVELRLFLSAYQLDAIEQHCRECDMKFELTIIGEGGQAQTQVRWPLVATITKRIIRSEWLDLLRAANAMDILLVEIPMPLVGASAEKKEMVRQLRHAQTLYKQKLYTDCVGTCRKVMEELGKLHSRNKKWAAQALDRYQGDREGMTKEERETALQAALFHYTCAGSHAEARGGSTNFDRDEARMALTVTATFVGRLFIP